MSASEDSARVPKFNGTGFGLWKKRVKAALSAKNLELAVVKPEGGSAGVAAAKDI